MSSQRIRRRSRSRYQHGLSLVELLVGVALGIFIVGGALKLTIDTVNTNRRALLETRVNQDLRAAADLVARDLRRAGYWNNALKGVWGSVAATPTPNPHKQVSTGGTSSLGTLAYSYSKDTNDTLDTSEQFGYDVSSGVLRYQNAAGNSQPITDPNSVLIDADGFAITQTQRQVELYSYCSCITQLKCFAADFATGGTYAATRPILTLRQYDIRIKGTSASDPNVKREIRQSVRVRNDDYSGTCPTIL